MTVRSSPGLLQLRVPLLLLLLWAGAGASSLAGEAQPGQPREDVPARSAVASRGLPPGMGWLRAFSGECRSCLRECLGSKATALQQASLKYQAPLSLVTWYLFRNRPFKMWPLEEVSSRRLLRRSPLPPLCA